MQSPAEPQYIKSRGQSARDAFNHWNRRGHYYLGLYFLFFLWLFAFTGLLLNHSWRFAEFWPNRKVSKFERHVQTPTERSDVERAHDVVRQLGIRGELEWTSARVDATVFSFRVTRPGRTWNVTMDPAGRVAVEQTDINGWGLMRVLHTFTGVRRGDARNERDWVLTTIWALSMDAVALGMCLMVLSGAYLWIRLPQKRKPGLVALLAGTVACGFFVFGLRLIYT
jgi:hypothetical protein